MAHDAEVDRLKAAQNLAFQRKQDAFKTQQAAWVCRAQARDVLSRAYEAKQLALVEFNRTWQLYQEVRRVKGPRIDALNTMQDEAYQNMRRSIDAASSAYNNGSRKEASSLSAEGRRYRAESQGFVT